jgi:hypothetical protein
MVIYCPVVIGPLIVSKHTIRTQFRTVMHNCRSLLTIIFSTFSLPLHTDLGIGARLSFRPPPKVVDESIAVPFPPLPPMSVPWCSSVDESKTDEVSQPTTAHIRRLIESQQSKPKTKPVNPATLLPHAKRCGCGCIPQIPTLFEMAELRRQYKLRLMEEESDIAKEAY